MEGFDLVVDYNELEKDQVVNIKVLNVKPAVWQTSAVTLLITLANLFSPVKFNLVIG